jgi:hypothetical protein
LLKKELNHIYLKHHYFNMSNYKNHLNNLQCQLEGLRYFQEERLRLLMLGIDLQIINRELEDLKGYDETIDKASILTTKAKELHDTMFARYEASIIQLDIIRSEALALCEYTKDLEKQLEAHKEL